MKIFIKNMVCPRCVQSVEQILKNNKMEARNVLLGEVELIKLPGKDQLKRFADDLGKVGFELLDDRKTQLINRMKTLLIGTVQAGAIEEHFSLQKYITQKIFRDYSSLSKLFSEVEGITVEQFFILQKIEKAKEWLTYDEFSLGEIALNLGYSSTQHLSAQFKRLTGMTPTRFRKLGAAHRKPIDDIKQAGSGR
jgi:AraC-like DNA-binding protein